MGNSGILLGLIAYLGNRGILLGKYIWEIEAYYLVYIFGKLREITWHGHMGNRGILFGIHIWEIEAYYLACIVGK